VDRARFAEAILAEAAPPDAMPYNVRTVRACRRQVGALPCRAGGQRLAAEIEVESKPSDAMPYNVRTMRAG
jgi:hypothetical protein